MKKKDSIPVLFSYLIIITLSIFIVQLVKLGKEKTERESNQRIVDTYSRMSTSEKVQKAYEYFDKKKNE